MAVRQYLRILTPPKGSFFLYGVRGVGKSTWARETFPDAHIIDLLDESRYQALLANPALLGLELRTLPAHRVVVLDEVQRVPALLNEVHRAIEGARRRFVLLGSSARRLKTADTNLLAGRAALRTMYPLVPAELGADFDLARVLRFGSIPVVWQADDPRAALEAYVQLYVREEIRTRGTRPQPAGVLAVSPRGRVVPRTGDQHCGSRARCCHRADDDRGIPRHSPGHAGGDAPAGIRSEAARARTATPETLLGRSGAGSRREATAGSGRRRGTWTLARRPRPDDLARPQ